MRSSSSKRVSPASKSPLSASIAAASTMSPLGLARRCPFRPSVTLRRGQAPCFTVLAASSDAGAGETSARGSGRRKVSSGNDDAMAGGGGLSSSKKRPSSTSSAKKTSSASSSSSSPSSSSSSSSSSTANTYKSKEEDDARLFAQLSELELQDLPLLERLSLAAGEKSDSNEEEQLSAPVWAGRRGGYTPFEYVDFTDEDVLHEVQVTVDKPREHVFEVWADRLNYGEWFSLLGQAVLHADSPELASYFVFYKWGQLPPLELYATLARDLEESESVLERSVDGWDLAVGAFFEPDRADPRNKTVVTLRLGYALPAPLAEHVGSVGIYGHVEEILRADMRAMKRFIESGGGSDLGLLRERRKEEEAALAAQVQEERSKGADSVLVAASQAESQGLYDEEVAEYGDGDGGDGDEGGEGGEASGASRKSRGGGGGGARRRSKTAAAAS